MRQKLNASQNTNILVWVDILLPYKLLSLIKFSVCIQPLRWRACFYYFSSILTFKCALTQFSHSRGGEKKQRVEFGNVSGSNVDVTVGVLRGIWLCRYPGVHQHKQCLSETEDVSRDKAAFDGSLSAVLVDAAEITEAAETPGRHISGWDWLDLKYRHISSLSNFTQACVGFWHS